jgi:hypothetical protein
MVAGKHALSTKDVKGLGFDGYKKIIELREPFIIVRFKKTGS